MDPFQASGNSVFGIPNYVDIVTGQSKGSNPVSQTAPLQYVAAHYQDQHMFSLQQNQIQQHQQLQIQPEMLTQMANGQPVMTQQAMMQQGLAVQQMVPGAQMIMAPGLGGYMQYPQIHPAAIGMAAGQMGQIQMGMQPLIIQPMAVRPSAKPVGRVPGRTSIFGNSPSTGLLADQSGAGKVKKKKPSPSARRRSRLRLIAFLEAKRKKAEEEGLEPVPELSEEQMREMTDEQLAAHLAAANASRDGSVCQSEESNPTSSSAAPQNSAPISGTAASEATNSEATCSDTKKDDPTTDGPNDSVTQKTSSC